MQDGILRTRLDPTRVPDWFCRCPRSTMNTTSPSPAATQARLEGAASGTSLVDWKHEKPPGIREITLEQVFESPLGHAHYSPASKSQRWNPLAQTELAGLCLHRVRPASLCFPCSAWRIRRPASRCARTPQRPPSGSAQVRTVAAAAAKSAREAEATRPSRALPRRVPVAAACCAVWT